MYDYVGGSAIICLSLNSQRRNALGPPVSEAASQLVEAILTCFFFFGSCMIIYCGTGHVGLTAATAEWAVATAATAG